MNGLKYSVRFIAQRNHRHVIRQSRKFASTRSAESGGESDSEKWRRIISDSESGFISSFEDEDGNVILPRGQISNATPLRSLKGISQIDRVRSY